MHRHAIDLYTELLSEAIDLNQLPNFWYYKNMTTAHAERMIISLMEERKLYRNNDRLFIRLGEKLCFIFKNKSNGLPNVGTCVSTGLDVPLEEDVKETIRIELPFSPKRICNGMYKSGQLKRISDYFQFNQVVYSLID